MKVIQIIYIPDSENAVGCYTQGAFMALCDDGSIWDRTQKCVDPTKPGDPASYRPVWTRIPGPTDQEASHG